MVALAALPLLLGALAAPQPARACHGNGVSRSCQIDVAVVRLEAVSYEPFYTYAWIYTEAWYFRGSSFFLYGDNACLDDWRCVHGIYESGSASWHQISGGHRF
jgi:hypothetical protein